jgi:hypothetical protein
MNQEFISINNTIQDYEEYVKNTILLKNYLKNRIKDLLFEEDFIILENRSNHYHESELVFYNQTKDVEVKITIKKRNDEVFV